MKANIFLTTINGQITLGQIYSEGGVVKASTSEAQRLLMRLGESGIVAFFDKEVELVYPRDGEKFIEALPNELSGSYIRAVLIAE